MTILKKRRLRAARIAKENGFGALAFVPGPNFFYLTGLDFHLMERPTILFVTSDGEILAIIPELERSRWRDVFPDAVTFFWQDSDGFDLAFSSCAKSLIGRIGVEGMRMRMFEFEALSENFPRGALSNSEVEISELRICKDTTEINNLKKAIEISEAALFDLIENAHAGDTEAELASRLKQAMLVRGAQSFGFDPIVLSGPNTADPHGTSGQRSIAPGEPLLIDFGASFGGMNADITRTFFCEHASDHSRAIYATVLEANTKGKNVAGPGVTCDRIDRETTKLLTNSNFADMIVHKTGHGLGLDVHEAPQIMVGNHKQLRPGMVITIEPGLYKSGSIGIRIEDDVLITDDGTECLTKFPREIRCF